MILCTFERKCFTNVLPMITFKGLIRPERKKEDGTWNVQIRVTYDRKTKYIPTSMFVSKEHLNTKQTLITSKAKLKKIREVEDEYREIVEDIAITPSLDTQKIIDFIKRKLDKRQSSEIDFAAFIQESINKRKKVAKDEKDKIATGYQTVLNSLKDFFQSDTIFITDITAKSLKKFEDYLKTERKVFRLNKKGQMTERILKPVGNGVNNYMRDVRALFNDAIDLHNDEDENEIVITHNPFKKYKIPKPVPGKKRNLQVDVIKKIKEHSCNGQLKQLGRDVFMIAFYLVGINNKDLFTATTVENDRFIYNRSKTKGRRIDKAHISIKLEPELNDLKNKYRDPDGRHVFNFYKSYKNIENFNRAVNNGLEQLSKELNLGLKVTSAYARTSWASIAHNICGVSKDDVDLALNHLDPKYKLADVYIDRDFTLIDKANRKVLDTLR